LRSTAKMNGGFRHEMHDAEEVALGRTLYEQAGKFTESIHYSLLLTGVAIAYLLITMLI
jgi:hypothetical protein